MATQPTTTRSIFDDWASHLQQIGVGLLAVGGGFALLCLVIGYYQDWAYLPLFTWGMVTAAVVVAAGLFCVLPDLQGSLSRGEALRAAVLGVLSGVGLAAAVAGLLLPFVQYREQLGGDLQTWRANSKYLAVCAGAFVGGLVLMFAGLSLGRSYERTVPALRRLMYGYNAVFSTLLLAAILGILNVLVYSPVWPFKYLNGQPIDWTAGSVYSLKPDNKELLKQLKEPVQIYVIMPTRDPAYQDALTLVRNCRDVNPQISWETLSPQLSDDKIKQLSKRYQLQNPQGLVVVAGVEPDTRARLIPERELLNVYTDQFGRPVADENGDPKYYFTGENALMKTLQQLVFNAKPVKVYFTQGNGELTLGRAPDPELSIGLLQRNLDNTAFVVAPLPFGKADAPKGVPEDANIVVVAGPTQQLSADATSALRDFVDKRSGKLLVLLGPNDPEPRGGMKQTGLEDLLRNYQVEVGNDRVLYAEPSFTDGRIRSAPELLRVQASYDSTNPVAKTFRDEHREFIFDQARTVGKLSEPSAAGPLTVDELIVTNPEYLPWADRTLTEDTGRLAAALRANNQLYKSVAPAKPLPLAVAVSDGKTPHIVAVGCSAFASDAWIGASTLGMNNFRLFRALLSWLVDRPELKIQIDDKPPTYALSLTSDRRWLLQMVPGLLMMLGVVTLGGAVWVVRRR
jgi:hypothetical protein